MEAANSAQQAAIAISKKDRLEKMLVAKKKKQKMYSEEMTELEMQKNAIKTGMMNGKKLTDKQIEGLKAGLTQGGNKINEVMSPAKRKAIDDAGGIENYKKLNPSPPMPDTMKLNTDAIGKDGKFKPIKTQDSNAGLPDHVFGPGPGQYRPKKDKNKGGLKPVFMPKPTDNPPRIPERRVFNREEIEIQESDKKGKGSGSKDACYHKVKSRYSVWPSAYASGALVKCRKVGAANWGNSSKKEDFSDWKAEFIWEDGDSAKKIEEASSPAWQRKEGKSESGGLNKKGVASYRAANPGSKLKTAVTTKPSKLKRGSKSAKRRKSFCSRMKGMKKKLTSAKTARDPDSRINKALRKWNC